MKKFVITFVLLFAAVNLMAQEHLSFKGIPIEGSMTEFCQKLKAKGFEAIEKGNNSSLFTGSFTGRDVVVGVAATDNGKDVFAVVITLGISEEWKSLVDTYNYHKELYIRKYGKPSISEEKNPARSNTNTALMAEVHQGRVVYSSMWKVAGGDIKLSIEKSSGVYEGGVVIRYRNSQNVEEKIKKDIEDI